MRSDHEPTSLRDVIRDKQARIFIGRSNEVTSFRHNLDCGADADERKVIYSISGPSGVGKSYLCRFYVADAQQHFSAGAVSSDDADDVLALLDDYAKQLSGQLGKFSNFVSAQTSYITKRNSLLADQNAPSGTAELLTNAAVRLTFAIAKLAGPTAPLVDGIEVSEAASQVNLARTYIAKNLSKASDYRLVLSPVAALTEAFLDDLNSYAPDVPNVVLGIDTFERRTRWTQEWLLRLLDETYGSLPANLILVLAGQRELDPSFWSTYRPVIERQQLREFDESEVRQLLVLYGVEAEGVIDRITELSGGLPVLVEFLAQNRPSTSEEVIDPTQSAVDLFLKHETAERRQLILRSAVTRAVTSKTLDLITESSNSTALFDEIVQMPFVRKIGQSWQFHQVIRLYLLRYLKERSAEMVKEMHEKLAAYHLENIQSYIEGRRDAEASPLKPYDHVVEALYHSISCRNVSDALQPALEIVVVLIDTDPSLTKRIAEVLVDAGGEIDDASVVSLGRSLLKASAQENSSRSADMFDVLLKDGRLNEKATALALTGRGMHRTAAGDTQAVADIEKGLALFGSTRSDSSTIIERGSTVLALSFVNQNRNREAIEQFDHLEKVQASPKSQLLFYRSLAHRALDDDEAADKYANQALDIDPDSSRIRESYATTLMSRGLYSEALDVLSDDRLHYSPEGLLVRAVLKRWNAQYHEAWRDFEDASPSKLTGDFALRRIEIMAMTGRNSEAIEDAKYLALRDTSNGWATYTYARLLKSVGRFPEADKQILRALSIGQRAMRRDSLDVAAVFNSAIYAAAVGNTPLASRLFRQFWDMDISKAHEFQAKVLLDEADRECVTLPSTAGRVKD